MLNIVKTYLRQTRCLICNEILDKTKNYCITSCKHEFHTTCIISEGGICPLCITPEFQNSLNQLEELRKESEFKRSTEGKMAFLTKFENMPESPEHYGYPSIIKRFKIAYEMQNIDLMENLINEFDCGKDPEHPERIVEWELKYAFICLKDEVVNISEEYRKWKS